METNFELQRRQLNQTYLAKELTVLYQRLLALTEGTSAGTAPATLLPAVQSPQAATDSSEAALETVCRLFNLSAFERHLLLLLIGCELYPAFAVLCAKAQLPAERPHPTLELAWRLFEQAAANPLTPAPIQCMETEAPLRYWRLISIRADNNGLFSPLKLDERILAYALGAPTIATRLSMVAEPIRCTPLALTTHQELVEQLQFASPIFPNALPRLINLYGSDLSNAENVALLLAHAQDRQLCRLRVEPLLPQATEQLSEWAIWLKREALLTRSIYLVTGIETLQDIHQRTKVEKLLISLLPHALLFSAEPLRISESDCVPLAIPALTPHDQQAAWKLLKPAAIAEERLAPDYVLSIGSLRQISQRLSQTSSNGNAPSYLRRLCREQSRKQLSNLVQVVEPKAGWEDLIISASQQHLLRNIALQAAQRFKVYHEWGFAAKSSRGLGISALFYGSSGTGKTFAAEVLAHTLQTDLYHIDLSQVTNKYVGETEKNLNKVFKLAEGTGTILLFDEADALFGKRSEVRDSHDRYANLEVSYLLQRMEAYSGLSILTTNIRNVLDSAFLRRIRFIVGFHFPDEAQRAQIWQRVFPASVPRKDLDFTKLARIGLSGAHIRNIALTAAFIAADANEPITMKIMLQAVKQECQKMEKLLNQDHIKDWV